MGTITLTLPVAGQDIDAGPVASNFADLQTLLNGNLDAANLAADSVGGSEIAPLAITNAEIAAAADISQTKLKVPRASVYRTSNVAIVTSTQTVIAFDNERFDNDVIHDNATNNSRLTCKTAGVYLISASGAWEDNASSGRRFIELFLNNATIIARNETPDSGASIVLAQHVSVLWDLAVNDYVELRAYQTSGANLNFERQTDWAPNFSMIRVA